MRREDIVIGVEYAQTGPLAYGVEPSTPPKRVRFVSKDVHVILTMYRVREREDGSHTYERVGHKIVPRDSGEHRMATPKTLTPHAFARKAEVGSTFWVQSGERGALLAEMYTAQGEWLPYLATPASVHRTWDEYVAKTREVERRRLERQRQNAPRVANAASRDLVEALRMIHPDKSRAHIQALALEILRTDLDRAFPEESS